MSLSATRWLIECRIGAEPQGLFLHVFDDGANAWSPDQNRALRFATREDADRFGFLLTNHFHSVEVPTALLAVPHNFDEDDEDDDFAAG